MVTCPHGSSQLGLGPAVCHFTTAPAGKIMGSRAKASIHADRLFPPPQSQQTERPKKQLPTSEQESVPSLCIPMLAPLSLCKSEQKDSWPHTGGTCRACGCARAEEPWAACHSLLLPRFLPPTLPARQIQPWSLLAGSHRAASFSTQQEQAACFGHGYWDWLPGKGGPLEKVQHISTSTSGKCSAPAPVCHALVSHPHSTHVIKYLLVAGNCPTVPDWRRQKSVGEGHSHQAVLSGDHKIIH